jgi:hypothetical protein
MLRNAGVASRAASTYGPEYAFPGGFSGNQNARRDAMNLWIGPAISLNYGHAIDFSPSGPAGTIEEPGTELRELPYSWSTPFIFIVNQTVTTFGMTVTEQGLGWTLIEYQGFVGWVPSNSVTPNNSTELDEETVSSLTGRGYCRRRFCPPPSNQPTPTPPPSGCSDFVGWIWRRAGECEGLPDYERNCCDEG